MRPLIIVAGPTASGKSALALRLAQALHGEIVSCDSVQVYRGFDIGSAKASADEQQLVPHHLIDCCGAEEQFHAARFRDQALQVIADMRARDVQPILAGGTTLYLSALLSGLSGYPESDAELRGQLQAMPAEERYELLRQLDPGRAEKLHPNDAIRIVRALEIVKQTGQPASAQAPATDVGLSALVINLCVPNLVLGQRIAQRTGEMIDRGLIEEVQALLTVAPESAAPFTTVGYRETLQFLKGEINHTQMIEQISISTRRLAKRQRTFWRNEPAKRGWCVKPDVQDTPTVVQDDLAVGTRRNASQKGYRALDLDYLQLLSRVQQRVCLPVSGVEVWHVALRHDQPTPT